MGRRKREKTVKMRAYEKNNVGHVGITGLERR